ncbi:hypothetical protein [Xanthomonas campestris]|uniref:hypothetical protein n=1 Tax=Xanthomonas campestris TaxID=339 RepID=UPI003CEE5D23
MLDSEIYELSADILSGITGDLNDVRYSELGGSLSLQWDSRKAFSAYALSRGSIDDPPNHCIVFHYEFVRQLWRDAENFCAFIKSIPSGSDVDLIYSSFNDKEKLPSCFSDEEHVRNLFVGALTWVYFHELGHLNQEHGYIRQANGGASYQGYSEVHELNAAGRRSLTEREIIVSHVTELAADYEATNLYCYELVRHIKAIAGEHEVDEVFRGLLYLMICGLSIVFYRFNGSAPPVLSPIPKDSHPDPLTRLELNIPHLFEMLDIPVFRQLGGYQLDRRELVSIASKATLSVSLFWSGTEGSGQAFDSDFLIKGVFSRIEIIKYLQPIIACWEELLPSIKKIRRHDIPLGLMTFTPDAKERISKEIVWGKG